MTPSTIVTLFEPVFGRNIMSRPRSSTSMCVPS